MDIKNLIQEDQETWVEYPNVYPSFDVKLKFASREAINRMTKNATVQKMNRYNQRTETVDDEKFMRNFFDECVLDWKGVTPRVLSNMIPMDVDGLSEEQLEEEVPFSQENIVQLAQADTTRFGDWVLEAVRDLGNFSKKNDKNS